MRIFVMAASLALLGACAEEPAGCAAEIQKPLAFASEADSVLVRTLGPSCDKAVGVLVLQSAENEPLWAWAGPLYPTFGNLFEARAGDPPTLETARAFLERWAEPRAERTSAAPPWPENAPEPPGGATITLDRATYEDVRARDLPMACVLTGLARESCIFWEPGAAAAGLLLERDARPPASDAPDHAPH